MTLCLRRELGAWKSPLALPPHFGHVARDLGRFFLELFAFCGRERFVARGDQGRAFFLKRQAGLRAFDKFVVKFPISQKR